MQIDTAAAIDLSKEKKQNESSFSDQMKAYIKHPGSGVLALLTLLGAVLTFALLFFLTSFSDQHIHPDGCFTCDRSTAGNLCSHLSGRICEKRK